MRKLIPSKVRHRFTLDEADEPHALCSLEPFMNYQLPPDPKLERDMKDVTCGFCHHLVDQGRVPRDRALKVVS